MPFARTLDFIRTGRDKAVQKLIRTRDLIGAHLPAPMRERLIQRVSAKFSDEQATVVQPMEDIIGSEYLNNILEAVFVDLNTIYDSFRLMAGARRYREDILDSRAKRIQSSIRNLKQSVKRLQALYENPGYDDAIFMDFANAANYSTAPSKAQIDPDSAKLKLEEVAVRDHTNSFFTENVEVAASILTPGMSADAGSFGPDKMVDPSTDTFWLATSMTDDVIVDFPIELADKVVDGSLVSQSNYSANGAVAQIDLSFRKARWVNNIRILPFGNYPLRVVQASYVPEEGGTYRQIPVFDVGLATQNIDQIDFSFEPIPVFALRLTLEQENYSKAQYQVPYDLLRDNIFWQDVVDSGFGTGLTETYGSPLNHLLGNISQLLSQIPYDYASIETREGLGKVLEAIPAMINEFTSRNKSLSDILSKFRSQGELVDIDKFEYSLGIKDIQINTVEYSPEGEWRSPPMIDNKGVVQIEALTTESHTVLDVDGEARPASSVAYSIDFGRQRRQPILPANSVDLDDTLLVKSEVLRFDRRTLVAVTRFPIDRDKRYAVYADNNKIRSFGMRALDNAAEISISSLDFNPNQVYTITYYPDTRSGYPVSAVRLSEINSRALEEPVVFSATGADNTLVLPSFPYIEYQVINGLEFFDRPDPFDGVWIYSAKRDTAMASDENGNSLVATATQISQGRYSRKLIDGIHYGGLGASTVLQYEPIRVTVDGSKAYNVTDYITGEHPLMPQTTQTNKKYQFIHTRNKVILNTAISDARIEVMYNTKADHIQLVAELFSNTGGSLAFTPILKNTSLLIRARYI